MEVFYTCTLVIAMCKRTETEAVSFYYIVTYLMYHKMLVYRNSSKTMVTMKIKKLMKWGLSSTCTRISMPCYTIIRKTVSGFAPPPTHKTKKNILGGDMG